MAEPKINKQDEIKIIEDNVLAVRKMPDVYIGALGNHGFRNMFREIVQNALDEIIKKNTLDLTIIVSYDERSKTVIVEDNGQGIELKMLDKVFSILHSSSNYDKKEGSGRYSSGKNGMGATITNYLSKFFMAESYRMDGTAAKVEFVEGKLSKKGIQKLQCPKNKHGLKVTFAPTAMVGDISVPHTELCVLLWKLVNMCIAGTTVVFNAIDLAGKKHRTTIKNTIGIYELLHHVCEKPLIQPIYFMHDNGNMKAEVLLSYDIQNMDEPNILGFANMCPSDAGTHIDGFLDGVVKYFRDYMNKIYLASSKKLSVSAQDIRTGLRAVVSTFHLNPMFTGQSKEIFSKEDMKPFIKDLTTKSLDEWAKSNPGDLQKVCKYLKEVCEIRFKTDNEKVKISNNYKASVLSGLPEGYAKPIKKKGFEVFIVEGKSAKGGAVNNRDQTTQGIFGVRGKMCNAFTTPTKQYFENEEVSGLFRIFGYSDYSRKFDPDKFLPEKVIIMTDADPDGKLSAQYHGNMVLAFL